MIKRLKELRSEKQLNQKQLAALLNITQQTYSDYETGRTNPDIDTLLQISKILECSIDYLLGNSDDFGNIVFTEEEKALGLSPNHAVVLSDDDRYRIHLLAEAEEKLGKAYVDGVLKMIELSIQNKK